MNKLNSIGLIVVSLMLVSVLVWGSAAIVMSSDNASERSSCRERHSPYRKFMSLKEVIDHTTKT